MVKRNMLLNALHYKCPKCQRGDLYTKPFEFSKPVNMPDHCLECGQSFMPEPGFYYGSMFLSYIMSGFTFLSIVALCIIVFKMSVNAAMGILVLIAILIYFPLLRFSRSLWINLMVKYKPNSGN